MGQSVPEALVARIQKLIADPHRSGRVLDLKGILADSVGLERQKSNRQARARLWEQLERDSKARLRSGITSVTLPQGGTVAADAHGIYISPNAWKSL